MVADANLEPSWAPINELDGALCLESGNCAVDIMGYNVTSVEQAGGHVFAVAGVTLDHLVVGLETRVGDLLNRVGLMLSLRSRDDWSIGHEGEVDSWVWDEVGLELVQVDVERSIKSKGSRNGGND